MFFIDNHKNLCYLFCIQYFGGITIIGVSPAFFIAQYSNQFSLTQILQGLETIAKIGFKSVQLEIFWSDFISQWMNGGNKKVKNKLEELDLFASQFVAHFLLHSFESPKMVTSDYGIEELKILLDILQIFPEIPVITIPMPAFKITRPDLNKEIDYHALYLQLTIKLKKMLDLIESSQRKCQLELMPGALINSVDGFIRLANDLQSKSLGYNFDTGHAHACGENLALIAYKLKGRIYGTHLCDNCRYPNLNQCPGQGNINWGELFYSLHKTGYQGSFDLEIICEPEKVEKEYARGYTFIKKMQEKYHFK